MWNVCVIFFRNFVCALYVFYQKDKELSICFINYILFIEGGITIEYTMQDLVTLTGRSYTTIKKWRLAIEKISDYKFKVREVRVNKKQYKDIFYFSDEEKNKFCSLARLISKTNNITSSVIEIWGEKKNVDEIYMRNKLLELENKVKELRFDIESLDVITQAMINRITTLELNDKKNNERGVLGFLSGKKG